MMEQFLKQTKSIEEKEGAVKYLANEKLHISDVEEIYGKWAAQFDQVKLAIDCVNVTCMFNLNFHWKLYYELCVSQTF